jgi:DegV family protein with EDD domain
MAAAEAAYHGCGRDEIMRIIQSGMDTTSVFVALPTLKYLRRSGRVPQVQAWVAGLLSIHPILGVRDGVVEAVERVRTFRGCVRRVVELAAESCNGKASRMVVMHTNALDEACALLEQAGQAIDFGEAHFSEMGGSMAVHGGPGMLGVAVTQV